MIQEVAVPTPMESSLLSLIRDGVELNYSSWFVWQWMARSIVAECYPHEYRDWDDQNTMLQHAYKRGIITEEDIKLFELKKNLE